MVYDFALSKRRCWVQFPLGSKENIKVKEKKEAIKLRKKKENPLIIYLKN